MSGAGRTPEGEDLGRGSTAERMCARSMEPHAVRNVGALMHRAATGCSCRVERGAFRLSSLLCGAVVWRLGGNLVLQNVDVLDCAELDCNAVFRVAEDASSHLAQGN